MRSGREEPPSPLPPKRRPFPAEAAPLPLAAASASATLTAAAPTAVPQPAPASSAAVRRTQSLQMLRVAQAPEGPSLGQLALPATPEDSSPSETPSLLLVPSPLTSPVAALPSPDDPSRADSLSPPPRSLIAGGRHNTMPRAAGSDNFDPPGETLHSLREGEDGTAPASLHPSQRAALQSSASLPMAGSPGKQRQAGRRGAAQAAPVGQPPSSGRPAASGASPTGAAQQRQQPATLSPPPVERRSEAAAAAAAAGSARPAKQLQRVHSLQPAAVRRSARPPVQDDAITAAAAAISSAPTPAVRPCTALGRPPAIAVLSPSSAAPDCQGWGAEEGPEGEEEHGGPQGAGRDLQAAVGVGLLASASVRPVTRRDRRSAGSRLVSSDIPSPVQQAAAQQGFQRNASAPGMTAAARPARPQLQALQVPTGPPLSPQGPSRLPTAPRAAPPLSRSASGVWQAALSPCSPSESAAPFSTGRAAARPLARHESLSPSSPLWPDAARERGTLARGRSRLAATSSSSLEAVAVLASPPAIAPLSPSPRMLAPAAASRAQFSASVRGARGSAVSAGTAADMGTMLVVAADEATMERISPTSRPACEVLSAGTVPAAAAAAFSSAPGTQHGLPAAVRRRLTSSASMPAHSDAALISPHAGTPPALMPPQVQRAAQGRPRRGREVSKMPSAGHKEAWGAELEQLALVSPGPERALEQQPPRGAVPLQLAQWQPWSPGSNSSSSGSVAGSSAAGSGTRFESDATDSLLRALLSRKSWSELEAHTRSSAASSPLPGSPAASSGASSSQPYLGTASPSSVSSGCSSSVSAVSGSVQLSGQWLRRSAGRTAPGPRSSVILRCGSDEVGQAAAAGGDCSPRVANRYSAHPPLSPPPAVPHGSAGVIRSSSAGTSSIPQLRAGAGGGTVWGPAGVQESPTAAAGAFSPPAARPARPSARVTIVVDVLPQSAEQASPGGPVGSRGGEAQEEGSAGKGHRRSQSGSGAVGEATAEAPLFCDCLSQMSVALGHMPRTQAVVCHRQQTGKLRLHGRRFSEFQVEAAPLAVLVLGAGHGHRGAAVGQTLRVQAVGTHQCRRGGSLLAVFPGADEELQRALRAKCSEGSGNTFSADAAETLVKEASSNWMANFVAHPPDIEGTF